MVYDYSLITHNVKVCGEAKVCSYSVIHDNVEIFGGLIDSPIIRGDAVINETHDYLIFKTIWAYNKSVTWTRSNNMWTVGPFYCTTEEFIKNAYEESDIDGKCCEATVNYVKQLVSIIENKNI